MFFKEEDHKVDDAIENKLTFKDNIFFPPNLFETILEKSKKIGCRISPELLKICLGYRNVLNWQNIDLMTYLPQKCEAVLQDEDFTNISDACVPVKKLTFCVNELTETMMFHLSQFSNNLEYLHIKTISDGKNLEVLTRENASSENVRTSNKLCDKIKLPQLKCLLLDFNSDSICLLDKFDQSSFSKSLSYLEIKEFVTRENACVTFTNYENLLALSLQKSKFGSFDQLLELVGPLQELRMLNLKDLQIMYSPSGQIQPKNVDISKLVACLPKLEHLELSWSNLLLEDIEYLRGKSLTYLGAFDLSQMQFQHLEVKEIGNGDNLDSVLSFMSFDNSDTLFGILCVIAQINFLSAESLTSRHWLKLEQVLGKCLDRYPYDLHIFEIMLILAKHQYCYSHWSKHFLARIERHYIHLPNN